MKRVFYVVVFIYMLYRTVYGLKQIHKENRGLSIDKLNYGDGKNYFNTGVRQSITCKGTNKNHKVEWVDPYGNVVQRDIKKRVFAQEHFVASHKTRVPALLLIFTSTNVDDTGVWECRSGDINTNVSICVIEPSTFIDTPTEVIADRGRSITLSCQAQGEPEPRLLWYRNGDIVTEDLDPSKYQLMTKFNSQGFEGLLTITSLDSQDSGEYNCVAIQEKPQVENCSASISMNITLHVNFAPTFTDGNDTAFVSGKENESVNLVCTADGFPTPTYRWFKDDGDILTEYPKDVIELQDNGEKALLYVIANSTTFGQKYICRATNKYGDVDKVFTLRKLEKPRTPDEITYNATDDSLQFSFEWLSDVYFPVDEFTIQYLPKSSLKKKGVPTDWKKSDEVYVKTEDIEKADEDMGIAVTLSDLNEDTEYWVRFRAVNDVGASQWTRPILVSTEKKEEEEEVIDVEEETDEPKAAAQLSDSTFYGIFFAGGIVVIAVGCMFAMRMV